MVEVRYQIERLDAASSRTRASWSSSGASPRGELDDMQDELELLPAAAAGADRDPRRRRSRCSSAQLVQLRAAAQQLEKNLDIARKNLDSLKVKAPVAGKLSAFTLEVGQSLAPGDRIAQIDDPDHFKVVADIDEFYLPRVDVGQRADYPLGGTTYQLAVAKIRPQVQNGQFQVELVFAGDAPAGVRRGQTAQVRLQLGQPTEAVLIPNAAFYNDTGGAWVFVVVERPRPRGAPQRPARPPQPAAHRGPRRPHGRRGDRDLAVHQLPRHGSPRAHA